MDFDGSDVEDVTARLVFWFHKTSMICSIFNWDLIANINRWNSFFSALYIMFCIHLSFTKYWSVFTCLLLHSAVSPATYPHCKHALRSTNSILISQMVIVWYVWIYFPFKKPYQAQLSLKQKRMFIFIVEASHTVNEIIWKSDFSCLDGVAFIFGFCSHILYWYKKKQWICDEGHHLIPYSVHVYAIILTCIVICMSNIAVWVLLSFGLCIQTQHKWNHKR